MKTKSSLLFVVLLAQLSFGSELTIKFLQANVLLQKPLEIKCTFEVSGMKTNHVYCIEQTINGINSSLVKNSPNFKGSCLTTNISWKCPLYKEAYFRVCDLTN